MTDEHKNRDTDKSPPAPALAPIREGQGDSEPRKAHYGDGVQPWDIILSNGWGPAFADANVIKYLRRTKNPEHSLESARWYYNRLIEGAAGDLSAKAPNMIYDWQMVFDSVEIGLSVEERRRVRGGGA